ncbi:MAG: hypothetical protein R2695_02940 [Acidimicrobiales bacterium]
MLDGLVDQAAESAGPATELQGGFTFAPVSTPGGEMVDAAGVPLPNVSLDFGLLTPGRAGVEWAAFDLRAAAADIAPLRSAFDIVDPTPAPLLVEIATADLSENRSHVGPGDRSALDAGAIDGLQPGDELISLNVFGVTVPGDPSREAGLSPQELFTNRRNEGLVRILGDERGARLNVDASLEVESAPTGDPRPAATGSAGWVAGRVRAVEGSTPESDRRIVTREFKQAVLAAGAIHGAAQGTLLGEKLLAKARKAEEGSLDGVLIYGNVGFGEGVRVAAKSEGEGLVAYIPASDGNLRVADVDEIGFLSYFSVLKAIETCIDLAEQLNAMNEAGGVSSSDPDTTPLLAALIEAGFAAEAATASSTTTTTTSSGGPATTQPDRPESEPPGPVSCGEPLVRFPRCRRAGWSGATSGCGRSTARRTTTRPRASSCSSTTAPRPHRCGPSPGPGRTPPRSPPLSRSGWASGWCGSISRASPGSTARRPT